MSSAFSLESSTGDHLFRSPVITSTDLSRFTYAITFAALITAAASEGAYLFCQDDQTQWTGPMIVALYTAPQIVLLAINAMGVKVGHSLNRKQYIEH